MNEQWYIVRCMSGQEGKAERILERLGYPYGWHPTESVRVSPRIYQRALSAWKVARGGKTGSKAEMPKKFRVKPLIHGYVLLPAVAIDVIRIKNNPFSLWLEVLCVGDAPYTIPQKQMAQMRQMPDRLREVFEEAERIAEQARIEALPVIGQEAIVTAGALQGYKGQVAAMEGSRVEIDFGMRIGCVTVDVGSVQRLAQ